MARTGHRSGPCRLALSSSCCRTVLRVPDPASRFQPEDVRGPSEVIDPLRIVVGCGLEEPMPGKRRCLRTAHRGLHAPALSRRDRELDSVASASPRLSSCRSAISRARGTGATTACCPTRPICYGRPEDLKALVEAAHARGLMVLLDVVYNHFGRDGNYLSAFAPQFFTDAHDTPWGAA